MAVHELNETVSDEVLAGLIAGGDERSFAMLMDRYQAKLMRYGRKFLPNVDEIEDVVQDVFIKTYQNIKGFDPARSFAPWIYRIAHNVFVNALRDRARDPLLFVDYDALMLHPDPHDGESAREREEVRTLVEQGIEKLSPTYREVIILYYLEELGYQEIADVLHVPVGTVGVRLQRARGALRKHIVGAGDIK